MSRVKIAYVGGDTDTLTLDDAQRGELVTAMAARNPAHIIADGNDHTVLNTQNITRIDYRLPGAEDVGSDTDEAEDTRTVAELKAALDAGGIEYDSDDRKADLQAKAKAAGL